VGVTLPLVASAAALPGRSSAERAEAALRRLGLTVTAANPVAVDAAGPAALVHRLFGEPGRARPLPGAVRGLVSAALVGGGSRPFAHPLGAPQVALDRAALDRAAPRRTPPADGYQGSDMRLAYGVASDTPADGAAGTVATLELSGWNSADLSTYASDEGLTLHSGQYHAVSVDGANPSTVQGGADDALEVDLDEEAILAIAPSADERAYIAPNTEQGYYDALAAVLSDALTNPGLHITALSISWGACELDQFEGDAAEVTAFEDVLADLDAAGVTVFASSGDSGPTDDCLNSQGNLEPGPNADFPASSPWVVGVGGTTLPNSADPAGQSMWFNAYGETGYATSELFDAPTWQGGSGSITTTCSSGCREVPDIASDADPTTGLAIYSSEPGFSGLGPAGGTSLAAPTQAALLTDELLSHGYSHGLGFLSGSLYAAAAAYAASGSGTDPFTPIDGTPTSTPGYSEQDGLGTPVWDTLFGELAGAPHLVLPATSYSTSAALSVVAAPDTSYVAYGPASVEPLADASSLPAITDPACPSDVTHSSPPSSVTLGSTPGTYLVQLVAKSSTGACFTARAATVYSTDSPSASPSSSPSASPSASASPSSSPSPSASPTASPTPSSSGSPTVSPTSSDGPSPAAPVVRARLTAPTGDRVSAHWSAVAAPAAGDPVTGYHYVITTGPAASAAPAETTLAAGELTGRRLTVSASPGTRVTVAVDAIDVDGRSSPIATATVEVPLGAAGLTRGPGWRVERSARDYLGQALVTTHGGRWLSAVLAGRRFVLLVDTGPTGGILVTTVDGVTHRFSLYSPRVRHLVRLVVASFSSDAARRIRVRTAGLAVPRSRGHACWVDGLTVTR
jgi:hypothetical protein